MPINNSLITSDQAGIGTEVMITQDDSSGVEVQNLRSYGIGIDCHSCFIAVCVHVRRDSKVFRYQHDFDTNWDDLVKGKQWVLQTLRGHSDPVPDLEKPIHYVIEATSTYHMPVLLAWGGILSVINPMLAGATRKKTDKLDAERLSFHDLTRELPERVPLKSHFQARIVVLSLFFRLFFLSIFLFAFTQKRHDFIV